jgi:hypothetical protein
MPRSPPIPRIAAKVERPSRKRLDLSPMLVVHCESVRIIDQSTWPSNGQRNATGAERTSEPRLKTSACSTSQRVPQRFDLVIAARRFRQRSGIGGASMTKHFCSAVLTAFMAMHVSMSIATAKQQCSASIPSNSHGHWSWRFVDERKCWYEGKPKISKSSLEWPPQAASRPVPKEELATAPPEKPGNPADSQARANDAETFDALWRARIDRR